MRRELVPVYESHTDKRIGVVVMFVLFCFWNVLYKRKYFKLINKRINK